MYRDSVAKISRRTYKEVDVGDIKDASPKLKTRGMLGDVSPMKKGKSTSYFHGEMTDGRGKVCLDGFDNNKRGCLRLVGVQRVSHQL